MTLNMTIPKTQNPGGTGLFNPTRGGGGGLFNPTRGGGRRGVFNPFVWRKMMKKNKLK